MRSRLISNSIMVIAITILCFTILFMISTETNGEYSGEFVSGDSKIAEPGDTITMEASVENTGSQTTNFTLDEIVCPDGWYCEWLSDNPMSIDPHTTEAFSIVFDVSGEHEEAIAGDYSFEVTGEYDTEGGGTEPISGTCYLNITVEEIYEVLVDADDYSDNGDPGDTITFQAEVENTGNVDADEEFKLTIIKGGSPNDAKPWASLEDVDPGDMVTLSMGEKKFVKIVVHIPEFTAENDEAKQGTFGLALKAQSTTHNDVESEKQFEIEVEEFYNIGIWCDFPWKEETLRELKSITISYELTIRNLGNTDDTIEVTVPNDEFSGDMSEWRASIDGQMTSSYSLESLEYDSIYLDLTIDKNTDASNYDLNVRAESQGDTSMYIYTTVHQNLTKANYQVGLESYSSTIPDIYPSDDHEIRYQFGLYNYGDVEDVFTVEVITPLMSGTYRDWQIYFRDRDGNKTQTMRVPEDVNGWPELDKNDRVDIWVYVVVDYYEDSGTYSDIGISATSGSDHQQEETLYFSLDVIRPDIRISDDPDHFFIDPSSDIEVGDTIDINVRVYNDGDMESDSFYVWFYNGEGSSPEEEEGDPIAIEKMINIPADTFYDIVVSWDGIPEGINDIFVYADKPVRNGSRKTWHNDEFSEDGSIIESREWNNHATIHTNLSSVLDLRSDLIPVDVTFSDTAPGSENVTVTVQIRNNGSSSVESGTASVRLKIGDQYLKEKNTKSTNPFIQDAIPINDFVPVEFTWNVPSVIGKFPVTVTMDHPHDRNISNNVLNTTVTIRSDGTDPIVTDPIGPDLLFMLINPGKHSVGKEITFSIGVRNQGDTTADASVSVFITQPNSTHLGTFAVNVPFGDMITVKVKWTPHVVANYTFLIRIHDVQPQDYEESNNEGEFTVEVVEDDGSDDDDDSSFIPGPGVMSVLLIVGISAILYCSRKDKDLY